MPKPDLITLDTFKALADLPLPDDVHTWTWERAARHSLRKWELISEYYDADRFDEYTHETIRERYMCSVSCALCHRSEHDYGFIDCTRCPLQKAGYGCDEDESPWFAASERHAYRPMVHALRQAVVEAHKLDHPYPAPATPSVTELLTKEGAD